LSLYGIETLDELLSWQSPDIPNIIDHSILASKSRLFIYGARKSWKSGLILYTGFCLANGDDWFGIKTVQTPVLIYQAELPKHMFKERIAKYSQCEQKAMADNLLIKVETDRLKLDTNLGLSTMSKYLERAKALFKGRGFVVILDPLFKMMAGHPSDSRDTQELLDNIDLLKEKYDCAFIVVHHTRKTQVTAEGAQDFGVEEMTGSGKLGDWCDTAMRIKVTNPQPHGLGNKVEMTFDLARSADKPLPIIKAKFDKDTLHPVNISTTYPEEPNE
jgi:RecA-family ATPase